MPISRPIRARAVPALAAALLSLVPAAARAQLDAAAERAESRRPIGSLSVGVMQFDLSGTGTAPMAALRVDLPWSTYLWFEPGIVVARPEQQSGETTTFVVPEVHAHAMLPLGLAAPYVGAGIGRAYDMGEEGTASELSLAGALGVRLQFAPRLGGRAELRVRGLGTDFVGSTAEWTVGAALRF